MKYKILFIFNIFFSLLFTWSVSFANSNLGEMFFPDEQYSIALDKTDPLKGYKTRFCISTDKSGNPQIYLKGNSLGLSTVYVKDHMEEVLSSWTKLEFSEQFKSVNQWQDYHEKFRPSIAKILGAKEEEVVLMNNVTTNLHLSLISFYKPTKTRYKIIIEAPSFSSDIYIIKNQLKVHGYSPEEALVLVESEPGSHFVKIKDFEEAFNKNKDSIAVVLVNGVNYLTGQALNIKKLAELSHKNGAIFGVDLTHAAGNIPLKLHKWGVDFAAWCNFKYLSGGPGAIGGLFVHNKHVGFTGLQRFAGWWEGTPGTEFQVQLGKEFVPLQHAHSWPISNPSILGLVPLRSSLEIFEEIGMAAYREKSVRLTAYLEYLIDYIGTEDIEIITPRDFKRRGCQLSLLIKKNAEIFHLKLQEKGIICDFLEPNIIRLAPVPLYNTYHDVWSFANVLSEVFKGKGLESN